MALVKVERSTKAKVFRVALDTVRLPSEAATERNLPPGKHVLTWTVFGNAGQSYKIAVTKPPGTGCTHEATLDTEGRDFGFCEFTLA